MTFLLRCLSEGKEACVTTVAMLQRLMDCFAKVRYNIFLITPKGGLRERNKKENMVISNKIHARDFLLITSYGQKNT